MSKLTPEHTSRHPDSDSYSEVTAAYSYVDSVLSTADAQSPAGGFAWHGWALREAFLAGCTHARTLLAQPEPEGLADEELDGIYIGLALPGMDSKSIVIESSYERRLMRAAIAADRARRPTPQPPADGEVGELVEWLRESAHYLSINIGSTAPPRLASAAALLQRFASPACVVIDPDKEALAASIAADLAGPGIIERLPAHMQLIEPSERTVLVPVAQPVADAEYREAWDMSSDQGSECFASAIISRLVGYEEVEEDLRPWLAAYLRANALPLPQGNDN